MESYRECPFFQLHSLRSGTGRQRDTFRAVNVDSKHISPSWKTLLSNGKTQQKSAIVSWSAEGSLPSRDNSERHTTTTVIRAFNHVTTASITRLPL